MKNEKIERKYYTKNFFFMDFFSSSSCFIIENSDDDNDIQQMANEELSRLESNLNSINNQVIYAALIF